MAEHVQATLDKMVAPLRDLMDRNIFTEEEVKAIVARRRDSEYLLRRRVARKADFLRYIETEQNLEELRHLRTLQRRRDHRNAKKDNEETDDVGQKPKEKQHIGDVHIVQNLHVLFVRALRKFRSDLSLHLLHADFCKEHKSYTRLGRVYAEALQVFPREAGLWIEAASHEFFGPQRSIRSARILLQRGLRINDTSEDLWVEYFSLELHYAQTLKGRRQVLQVNKTDESTDENKEGNTSGGESSDYKISAIVYKNAIKAIPDSIPFRLRFLDTCRRFPDTSGLMDTIQSPLQADFSSQPEAWIARALYEAQKQSNPQAVTQMEKNASQQGDVEEGDQEDAEDKDETSRPAKRAKTKDSVLAVLEEAIDTVSSDEMNFQAFMFAQRYLDEVERGNDHEKVSQVEGFIKQLLTSSSSHGLPDFALEQSRYFQDLGDVDRSVNTLQEFCTTQKEVPASLWIRWAGLAPKSATSILRRALKKITMERPDHLKVLLQFFGSLLADNETDKDKLHTTFQQIVVLAPTASDMLVEDVSSLPFGVQTVAHAYLMCLEYMLTKFGVEEARKVYTSVLFQSSVKVSQANAGHLKAFVDKCTTMEHDNLPRLRRVYDKVVEIVGGTPFEDLYKAERNEMAVYR